VRCDECRPQGEWPHAPWVGPTYTPDGIVLLARNPSETRNLTDREKNTLARLKREANPRALQAWSDLRIKGGSGIPGVRQWGQWTTAFGRAVGPCLPPERTAWLNVVYQTGEVKTGDTAWTHGRAHLVELLATLRPRAIVTRFDAARDALKGLPGPWEDYDVGLLHLSGRAPQRFAVDQSRGNEIHRVLHQQFALPHHTTCTLPGD
jgi:hypothetical protein